MNWFCLCFVHVLILITCLLQMPSFASAAEVLQVREADLLLIGDQKLPLISCVKRYQDANALI